VWQRTVVNIYIKKYLIVTIIVSFNRRIISTVFLSFTNFISFIKMSDLKMLLKGLEKF